jgi:apolipoprotein N-acyltransferase
MNAEKKYNTTFKAAAIQANIGTAEKWGNDPDGALIAHEDLAELATADGADLVVMAETAIPFVINNNEILTEYIESIVYRNKIDLIVGCYTKSEKRDMYNSTVYVSNESGITDQIYRKQKLVPFGEYIPMGSTLRELFPFLSELNMLSSDIAPGITSSIMETEYGKIGSLICFDSIYENIALQTVRDGAEILAISTNDAWFRDSAAANQHNAHAILRSVELGRYVIRAGNTGISSIITDKGEIIDSLPALVEGYTIGEVKTTSEKTPYTYVGNMIIYAAFAYLLSISVVLVIRTRSIRQREARADAIRRC